jgi:hypothetical protein
VADPLAEIDGLLNGLNQQVDDQIQQQMDQAVAGVKLGMQGTSVEQPAAPVKPAPQVFRGDGAQPGIPAGSSPQELSRVHQQEELALWLPTEEDVEESWHAVLNSRYVQNTPLYVKRLGKVNFNPELEDLRFNAGAIEDPDPRIIIYGGMVRAFRLIAAGLALHMQLQKDGGTPSHLPRLCEFLGEMIVYGGLDDADVDKVKKCFLKEYVAAKASGNERFYRVARSLRAGMEMSVIAHEAGHIALGHTDRVTTLSYEYSRDHERQADSFAACVIREHPNSEHNFLGHVFSDIICCWIDHAAMREALAEAEKQSAGLVAEAEDTTPTMHPASIERFENSLDSMPGLAKDVATQYGLTREVLEGFLPPTGGA